GGPARGRSGVRLPRPGGQRRHWVATRRPSVAALAVAGAVPTAGGRHVTDAAALRADEGGGGPAPPRRQGRTDAGRLRNAARGRRRRRRACGSGTSAPIGVGLPPGRDRLSLAAALLRVR